MIGNIPWWKLLRRGAVMWAIETTALVLATWILPGVSVGGLGGAAVAVLAIGLANAILRPLLLLITVRLPIIIFALTAFLLNAVIILLVAALLPSDFVVEGLLPAIVLSIMLAALNAAISTLLHIDDEDSYYENVVRLIARRNQTHFDGSIMGTVIIQIDGLAAPILEREMAAGHMPTLSRWLRDGSHRLVEWECGVPSMTTASQAGILYGNNDNIPAFRWFDKSTRTVIVSNHPPDALLIDTTFAGTDAGLLADNGSSIANIFAGGAQRTVMTMSGLYNAEGQRTIRSSDFGLYLVNPYNLTRGVALMLGEVVREYWQAFQQRRRGDMPRMKRGGVFPFLRAATCVLMRDAAIQLVIEDMYRGRTVSYADLLGYDEVAHHAGPLYRDALDVLRQLDREFKRLEDAGARAPRPYQFVVVSDHGQSWGSTFRQRYGYDLGQLVRSLVKSGVSVGLARGKGEGWAHANAMLSEVTGSDGRTGRTAERLLRSRTDDNGLVQLGPATEQSGLMAEDIAMCASGNLALLYFARHPGQLTRAFIEQEYPGLIDGIVTHDGIGIVVVRAEGGAVFAFGPTGCHELGSGAIEGIDPLLGLPASTAHYLERIMGFSNAPDLLVNSFWNAQTGEVAAFEELIGCHGGAGGWQTRPLLIYPAGWSDEPPAIVGAEQVHGFLKQHVGKQPVAGSLHT